MTANLLAKPATNSKTSVLDRVPDDTSAGGPQWLQLECSAERSAIGRTYNHYWAAVEYVIRMRHLASTTSQELRFNEALAAFKTRHRLKAMLISLLDRKVSPFSN
jgi:hypothetical protein